MPSTYTNILRLELQADGENDGTWGQILNDNVIKLIEDSIASTAAVSTSGGTTTLSTADGAADQARRKMIEVTGSLGSNAIIEVPAQDKTYLVRNDTSGSYTVEVLVDGQNAGAGVIVPQGCAQVLYCDGTNVKPGTPGHAATVTTRIAAGGTSARPSVAEQGDIRYNSDNAQYEGYDGSAWGALGGAGYFQGENGVSGDKVNGKGDIFRVNEQTLNTDTTISAGDNASCAGPLTVASGTTLTVNGNLTVV